MLTHNQVRLKLLRRAAILVDNDRALFEQQLGPLSNEDCQDIQRYVDDFVRELRDTADTIEDMVAGRSLRECRTDIERPSDV